MSLRKLTAEERRERAQLTRYTRLLVGLLVFWLAEPFLLDFPLGDRLLRLFFAAVLLSAMTVTTGPERKLAWVLGIPPFVLWVIDLRLAVPQLEPIGLVLAKVFLVFTVVVVLWDVFAGKQVTADKIVGAVCAFLLLGLLWALVFQLLEYFLPGSFSILGAASDHAARNEPIPWVYFSFSTLTTLGYGDMVPVRAAARTFAWLEAVIGQIYLTVLVARLVGLHLAQSVGSDS